MWSGNRTAYRSCRSSNYWVSDDEHFKVQVLVYELQGDRVSFRRNPEVTWPLNTFTFQRNALRIVNPLVPYAFKVTNKSIEPKDLLDVSNLLNSIARNCDEQR